jgi:hypothetical protein
LVLGSASALSDVVEFVSMSIDPGESSSNEFAVLFVAGDKNPFVGTAGEEEAVSEGSTSTTTVTTLVTVTVAAAACVDEARGDVVAEIGTEVPDADPEAVDAAVAELAVEAAAVEAERAEAEPPLDEAVVVATDATLVRPEAALVATVEDEDAAGVRGITAPGENKVGAGAAAWTEARKPEGRRSRLGIGSFWPWTIVLSTGSTVWLGPGTGIDA